MTGEQLNALCEIVYNIYKRTVKLSQYFVKQLVPFKKDILKLIDKRLSEAQKKVALIRLFIKAKIRAKLTIILKPILALINKDGKRACSVTPSKIRQHDERVSGGEDGWLVGFGFNGPLRQYFSLYRAVSQREGEREEKDRGE